MKLFVPALLLLILSCRQGAEDIVMPEPDFNIIPIVGESQPIQEELLDTDQSIRQQEVPHIPISSDYQVISLFSINIVDDEGPDDQIIITRPVNGGEEANLEIWIAEYRSNRDDYILGWQSELKAELSAGLVIQTKNILGSLTNEILITGFTRDNFQTLDIIYTESTIKNMISLFSIASKGSIEINYPEDISESQYNSSFTPMEIHLSETEKDKNDRITLIKTVWTLNHRNNNFVQTSQTRKAQDDQQREEMTNIIQGDEEIFLDHLEGFWYHETGFADEESLPILYFNPRENSIIFYLDNEFELYEIIYSQKGVYSKLYLNCENQNIRNVSRSITVSLEELDRLNLTVVENYAKTAEQSPWSSSYRRMGDALLQSLQKPLSRSLVLTTLILKGKYKSDDGTELTFDKAPLFTYKEEESNAVDGSYAIIQKEDQQIIEMVFMNHRSMVTDRRFYAITLNEARDENYIVHSLILTPGKLTIRGFQPSGERNLGFEQLEVLQ